MRSDQEHVICIRMREQGFTLSKIARALDTSAPRDGTMETRRCHAVLRCANDSCEANFWDRDVNAAINMVELLKSELCGDKRPVPFRRGELA